VSTTELDFVGEPFDALALTDPIPAAPTLTIPTTPPPGPIAAAPPVRAPAPQPATVAMMARELRATLVAAHEQSLRAQDALVRKALRGISGPADRPALPARPAPVPVDNEAWFKPLARTSVRELDADALARLAVGDIAAVFGSAYGQLDANPDLHTAGGLLASVSELSPRGGAWGRGRLTARTVRTTDVAGAVRQAAQVAALSFGLHLCLVDATLHPALPGEPEQVRTALGPITGPVDLVLDVTAVDLVPRPHLRVDAQVFAGGAPVGEVRGVTVAVVEKPGVPVGPEQGGLPARWLGRVGAHGDRVLLSEFNLAQVCRGDQALGLGPEFARYSAGKATRPPDGGLLLVDRVLDVVGERGALEHGSHRTEYDSPADSWYYPDTANASMPNVVYMETSLQAALMLGYHLGPTLHTPDLTISLRNLGGTATVLREVDLRDKTISQHSNLLSTALMPGASLQTFDYVQSVDGEPYYSGDTLFGYFSDAALANQTGLDAGRDVPTWLDEQQPRPATRTIDIAARRADPGARLVTRDHLALLEEVQVVDGGGEFGLGYLRSRRAINPADWFFARHFRHDPVIPGSLGVETVVQALQEWALDTGLGDDLHEPGFVLPVGLPFTWKYRGQFLPTDREVVLEAHIKSVARRPGRVRVVADASMWKPGLRIYQLTDIAVELREQGAQPW
jgi:3-hydroxymyristoyl/3-hydroxydecanoyl-(acyl carrier protein) dehydratase